MLWRRIMNQVFISKSENETLRFAREFAKTLNPGDIVLLGGDLGAGKTVFTKGIVDEFSCGKEVAVSPTFVIVNTYNTTPVINHFDLYRIENIDELEAIGIEEYLYSDGVCVVEWAERASGLFPNYAIEVLIEKFGDNERKIIVRSKEK